MTCSTIVYPDGQTVVWRVQTTTCDCGGYTPSRIGPDWTPTLERTIDGTTVTPSRCDDCGGWFKPPYRLLPTPDGIDAAADALEAEAAAERERLVRQLRHKVLTLATDAAALGVEILTPHKPDRHSIGLEQTDQGPVVVGHVTLPDGETITVQRPIFAPYRVIATKFVHEQVLKAFRR